jgi:protein O-GlcNAc transferase
LPALANGYVTFGCLNNFCKVSEATLTAWCRLLEAVPGSRLLLHARAGSHRERVREFIAKEGIASERVSFVAGVDIAEYFKIYLKVDIGLDPFPYGGGTTTCDALWMGVPVITLAGPTAVGRGGASILSNLDLRDLVAHSTDEYVRVAARLANEWETLSGLRAALRPRMQDSPLMDAAAFAHAVEGAYRTMWRAWCGTSGGV